jgi:hypothetical protein
MSPHPPFPFRNLLALPHVASGSLTALDNPMPPKADPARAAASAAGAGSAPSSSSWDAWRWKNGNE